MIRCRKRTCAIITAAGSGSRMGDSCKNKLLLELSGLPVIIHTLKVFAESPYIDEIILTVRKDDLMDMSRLCDRYGIKKISHIVCGGSTRQESVSAALSVLSDKTDFVAVHDGARPFVTPSIIEETVKAAYKHRAAMPCIAVTDTIKRAKDGFVETSVDRSVLRAAQTPQVFEATLYKTAFAIALSKGGDYTDDAQLIEKIGKKVYITEGSPENIKITRPTDIIFANAIFEKRRKGL